MASTQLLSLPAIHAYWTAALSIPPTARLSTLRRLVRAVTKNHHPALRPLSFAALCPLYLDLALAYAFLGEYYLASKVFQEAVHNDSTSAVGWFGLGLAQAELGEWKNARRNWKECLQCFETVDGQQESIRYVLFQAQDQLAQGDAARMLSLGLNSGEWILERTSVEWNFRVALREKGSKKLGVAPRAAHQKRPGLNGLSAGLRFGPGWDADLQSPASPLPPQQSGLHAEEQKDWGAVFISKPRPAAAQTPPSSYTSQESSASLPPRTSSRKPLPALPRSPPTPKPSLADEGSFNDHRPSLDTDPFTSSPEKDTLGSFSTSLQTLTIRERFSRQSTLFTTEDQYFHDDSDSDNDESRETSTIIDDTIASWSGLGQTHADRSESDQTQSEEDMASEETPQDHSDYGEILQPRVFEGFGSPSTER